MIFAQPPQRIKARLALAAVAAALPGAALAHASEQGFVLLLPTDAYITAGAVTVALTVLLLAVLPAGTAMAAFRPAALMRIPRRSLRPMTSTIACAVLLALIWVGINGPRDPLANPLPLFVWTIWWIALVTLQGLFGNFWSWIEPWSGPLTLIRRLTGLRPVAWPVPGLGHWPALAGFVAFAGFLLADPAPADPARLARLAGGYWLFTLAACLLFGRRWLDRAEGLSVLMRVYARLGLLGARRGRGAIGLWGWQLAGRPPPPTALAVFMLVMLAAGSFDGLNETFWWLARLGINPLEFPGRSAVIAQNAAGLLVAAAGLVAAFYITILIGIRISGLAIPAGRAFCVLAPSILPIALGYHIAHYLSSFLVDSQYALAALNDPMASGADLLGIGTFYVTTGFFNTQDSVRVIWLSQAGAVVVGHVLALILSHALAARHIAADHRAVLLLAPLALFMVCYTIFGLWLLASPRGL